MNLEQLKREIEYRTARSGGKGGQNVNKVETKVEAVFDIAHSEALTDFEKAVLLEKLANQLSAGSVFAAVNQTERSQLANKILVEQKLITRLQVALRPSKKRVKTKTPKRVVEARRALKTRNSEKKSQRRNWMRER